jgi:hypothetical protein
VVSESTRAERKEWRLSQLLLDGIGPQDLSTAT